MNETEGADREAIAREIQVELMRRIEALERRQEQMRSRIRLAALSVLAAAGLMLVMGLTAFVRTQPGHVAEDVESEKFVLRDADGMVRGSFSAPKDGSATFLLQDRDGRQRLRLTLLPDGSPGLTFADRDGRPRTVLGLLPDETSTMVFADRAGKTRAVLGVMPDQAATLVFADRDGETRAGLGVSSDGVPDLTLLRRSGTGEVADTAAVDSAVAGSAPPAPAAPGSPVGAGRRR